MIEADIAELLGNATDILARAEAIAYTAKLWPCYNNIEEAIHAIGRAFLELATKRPPKETP